MKQTFLVSGMSCSACSAHVEAAVRGLNGIKSVNVNLMNNKMFVDYDPKLVSEESIILSVKKAGYGALSEQSDTVIKYDKKAESSGYKCFFVSLVFLLILMYITMGHMLSLPQLSIFDPDKHILTASIAQCILSLIILVLNRTFIINGVKQLVHLSPGMDTLVSLGSLISWIYSFVILLQLIFTKHSIEEMHTLYSYLYFESAAMIPVLISLGKLLETGSKEKTTSAIKALMDLRPLFANRLNGNVEEKVDIASVKVGDILIVRSGETIPADGTIVDGSMSIDESALTGESLPVDKGFLDQVFQATTAYSGYIKLRVDKTDSETVLAKIIRTVEEAASGKAPIQRLADKICSYFVPFVLFISLLTFTIWMIKGYPVNEALNFAISVMVISCPCALGLATPTAIMAGTGKGASIGILIKSAQILEGSKKLDTILFDKTGTLTFGKLKVTDVIPWKDVDEHTLLSLAGACESMSEHPIAKAITEISRKGSLSLAEFRNLPGGGIEAKINGKMIFGGNYKAYTSIAGPNKEIESICDKLSETGKTPLIFTCDKKTLGVIAVADTIRPEAKEVISKLKSLGIECAMITGDNPKTSAYIADKIGITQVYASLTPVEKQQTIQRFKDNGKKVAMVGDGINDAPGLVCADVGIAIGAGTDIAIESADIVIASGSLNSILNVVRLSRRTFKTIKTNLFWAFFYNTIGIPIAAGVFYGLSGLKLNPMICAALMSCSSLFVVTNALRLRFFKGEPTSSTENNAVNIANEKRKDNIREMEVKVIINGMMCNHCSSHVEKAFNDCTGINATVDLAAKTAYLKLTKEYTDEQLKKIVSDAGYEPVDVIRA